MKQSTESQIRLAQLTKKFVEARNDSGLKKTNYCEPLRKAVASLAAEGVAAPILAKELGIAAATVKAWRKRYNHTSSKLEAKSDFLPLRVKEDDDPVKERSVSLPANKAASVAHSVPFSTQGIELQVTKISIKVPNKHLVAVLTSLLNGEVSA